MTAFACASHTALQVLVAMETLRPIIGHSEIGIRVLAISECAPRSGHSHHTTTGITIAAGVSLDIFGAVEV